MNPHLKKLKYLYVLFPLLVLVLTPGCSKPEPLKIGFSQCSTDDWREKMNDEIYREAMLNDSVEVEIRSADDDVARQIADIDHFIEEGYDVIAVAPIEAKAITPAIHRAMDAGIPVLLFDRETDDDRYTAYVGANNVAIGRMAAKQLSRDMPGGANILEIRGLDGSTPADGRSKGFLDEIGEQGDQYRIVASVHGRWNDRLAAEETRRELESHPEINMIYAHNDRMAIAAAGVKRELGRDSIIVYGVDAAPSIGIKAVADSIIDATFFYPTEGEFMLRTAVDLVRNPDAVPRTTLLPSSEPVTRENAELLLIQGRAIDENTDKIAALHERIDNYLTLQSTQRLLLIGAVIILLLMASLLFFILRLYWSHRNHQAVLAERNARLARQRDQLKSLNERLEKVTSARMIFFTNVSHDLRTPLTLIADPIDTVARAENLSLNQKKMMALANKNVKILRRLINQILDFRTAENDKLVLNATEVNLGELISEWASAFTEAAARRHLNLRINLAPEVGRLTLAIDA